MGGLFSSLARLLGTKKTVRMVMVGLDGAGKTTILYKLKLGELVQTVPTVGFNVETIRYKNISFTVWDVGGQYKIRALWRYYYSGVDAAIFVVDASDTQPDRLDECRDEIHYLMHENDLADAAVLIFANKQDLPGALSARDVAERLNLLALHQRRWYVQASSAKTGEGIYEGLEWLSHVIQERHKGHPIPFKVPNGTDAIGSDAIGTLLHHASSPPAATCAPAKEASTVSTLPSPEPY